MTMMRRRFMMQQGKRAENPVYSQYQFKGKFTDDSTEDVWVWRPNNLVLIGGFEHIPVDPVTKEFDLDIQEQSWDYFEPPLSSCKYLFSVARGDENCLERIDCLPDTSQVTSMARMFYACTHLISADLSGCNTSQVTDMSNMFSSCHQLQSLDLSGFDISNVESGHMMFDMCESLVHIRCTQAFKNWCIKDPTFPNNMLNNGTWEIVD